MEDDLNLSQMEDDLNVWHMEDDLNLQQMEEELNILATGRQPPAPPRDDALPNLTEGWLRSSKNLSNNLFYFPFLQNVSCYQVMPSPVMLLVMFPET